MRINMKKKSKNNIESEMQRNCIEYEKYSNNKEFSAICKNIIEIRNMFSRHIN